MKRHLLTALTAGLFSLLSFQAFSGEIAIKKLHKAHWLQLETENFIVYTDAKQKQAREMAAELEHFRYFIAYLLGYEQHPLNQKVPIILAKNRATFKALGFSDSFGGIFVENNGFVIFARADGFKPSSKGKGNWGRAVVLHELSHLLMRNSTLNVARPSWYNEGIAEYFGTYMEKDNNVMLGDMSVLGDRFYGMLSPTGTHFDGIDSESLFKTSQADLDIKDRLNLQEGKKLNNFYARSVAVTHYLNADAERRKQLFTYLALIAKGYSVDQTFAHVFEMTYEEFDKKVREYIFSRYVLARTFPIAKGAIEFPAINYVDKQLEPRKALETLFPKIMMLPAQFVSQENREDMYQQIEKIYPDFFAK